MALFHEIVIFYDGNADDVLASQVCRKGRGKVAKSFGLLPLLL